MTETAKREEAGAERTTAQPVIAVPASVQAAQLASIEKLAKLLPASANGQDDVIGDVSIPDSLKCAVCLELVAKPRKCFPCQHSFCEPCIGAVAVEAKNRFGCLCPLCRQNILYTFPDKELRNDIKASSPALFRAYNQRVCDVDLNKGNRFRKKMALPGLSSVHLMFKCCYSSPRVTRFFCSLFRALSIIFFGQSSGASSSGDPFFMKAVDYYFVVLCFFQVPSLYVLTSSHAKPGADSDQSTFSNPNSSDALNFTLDTEALRLGDKFRNMTLSGLEAEFNLAAFPGHVLICMLLMCGSRVPFHRVLRELRSVHAYFSVQALFIVAMLAFQFIADTYLTVTLLPFFHRFAYPNLLGLVFAALAWTTLLSTSAAILYFKHGDDWDNGLHVLIYRWFTFSVCAYVSFWIGCF